MIDNELENKKNVR